MSEIEPLDAFLERGRQRLLAELRQKHPREPRGGAKRGNPERDIQSAIVAFIRQGTDCLVNASINEAAADASDPDKRARFYASRAKAGATKGWPDLTVVWAGGVAFLECKAKGGSLSPAQRLVHARLAEQGHTVAVVRSLDEARDVLVRAGAPVRGRLHRAAPVQPLGGTP